MPLIEILKDYCTHRLLIARKPEDLKPFERKMDVEDLPGATDCSGVDCSPGRRIWQFVTESPAVPAVMDLSLRWPRLVFLLHYDCEDSRIIALIRIKNGRVIQHRFRY